MRFPGLVENEILKFARQRRFRVVVLILVGLIGLISFAQSRGRDRFLAGKDWHVATQERMARIQNGLRDGRMPPRCSGGPGSSSTACSTTSSAT